MKMEMNTNRGRVHFKSRSKILPLLLHSFPNLISNVALQLIDFDFWSDWPGVTALVLYSMQSCSHI